MAGDCGICGESLADSSESIKCSGECDTCFHLSCVPATEVKTRGSKRDFMCGNCRKTKNKPTTSLGSSKSTPGTELTKDFLVKTLEAFKTEVFNELKTYSKEFCELKSAMNFFSEKFEETNKLLEETNKSYKELKKDVEDLRQRNSNITKDMMDLQIRLRHMEQYSRKCNIEISGVPLTNNEDAISVVEDVGKAIGITLLREEVSAAHRVPSFRTGRAPPMIVQFNSRATRDQWIIKARERRDLTANVVNRSFPRNRVFIGEHLTPETKVLLARTKDKCKGIGWKFVWCREGKVFARKADGGKCVRIDSCDDLAKLE